MTCPKKNSDQTRPNSARSASVASKCARFSLLEFIINGRDDAEDEGEEKDDGEAPNRCAPFTNLRHSCTDTEYLPFTQVN